MIKRIEQLRSIFTSELDYSKNLSQKLDPFFTSIKNEFDDKKVLEVLESFYKIRDSHKSIAEDLIEQQKKFGEDWEKISFELFFKNYPSVRGEYIFFCNEREDFYEFIVKKKKVLKKKHGKDYKSILKDLHSNTLVIISKIQLFFFFF